MSWRESNGRDACHSCKRTVDLGAPVYCGERTPAYWCERCAADVLGRVLGDGEEVPKYRHVAPMRGFSREEMAAKLKAAILNKRRGMHVVGRDEAILRKEL